MPSFLRSNYNIIHLQQNYPQKLQSGYKKRGFPPKAESLHNSEFYNVTPSLNIEISSNHSKQYNTQNIHYSLLL